MASPSGPVRWADLTDPERDVLSSAGDAPLLAELGTASRCRAPVAALLAAGLVRLTVRTTWEGDAVPAGPEALDLPGAWERSLDAAAYVEVARTPAGDATMHG